MEPGKVSCFENGKNGLDFLRNTPTGGDLDPPRVVSGARAKRSSRPLKFVPTARGDLPLDTGLRLFMVARLVGVARKSSMSLIRSPLTFWFARNFALYLGATMMMTAAGVILLAAWIVIAPSANKLRAQTVAETSYHFSARQRLQ
jgi:hypothetical protein